MHDLFGMNYEGILQQCHTSYFAASISKSQAKGGELCKFTTV